MYVYVSMDVYVCKQKLYVSSLYVCRCFFNFVLESAQFFLAHTYNTNINKTSDFIPVPHEYMCFFHHKIFRIFFVVNYSKRFIFGKNEKTYMDAKKYYNS